MKVFTPSSNLQLYHNQLKQCLNRNIIRSQLQLKDDFFSAKGEINNSGTFISTPPEAVKGYLCHGRGYCWSE